jgi:hypothetical protein
VGPPRTRGLLTDRRIVYGYLRLMSALGLGRSQLYRDMMRRKWLVSKAVNCELALEARIRLQNVVHGIRDPLADVPNV